MAHSPKENNPGRSDPTRSGEKMEIRDYIEKEINRIWDETSEPYLWEEEKRNILDLYIKRLIALERIRLKMVGPKWKSKEQ
jgi:hypothetical protein